jgi:transposase
MNCPIALSAEERKTVLDLERHGTAPALSRRAHLILLVAAGRAWDTIRAALFPSPGTIARWQQRFPRGRLAAVVGQRPGRRPRFSGPRAAGMVRRVTERSPRDSGFLRSRWTCAVAVVLWVTEGPHRDGESFVRPLEDLRLRLRRYRVIHVICDNARFHQAAKWKRLQEHLKRWGHRIVLHYLPTDAPETHPIERVWWHLHEEITRNHRCRTMTELLDLVFCWLEAGKPFQIEGSVYPEPRAA